MDSPAFLPGASSSNLKCGSVIDIPILTNGMPLHVASHATNESSGNHNHNRNGNLEQPRRFKRSHCDKHNVVSGRSLKRLRLDHTLVTVPTHNNNNGSHPRHPFDAQSIGTLSVGTMGGDMESNDEDTGNYDDDDDDEEEEEGLESASQSSWVASLPSLASRRRMPCCQGQNGNIMSSAAVHPPFDEGDDAATCSEMTTAAVAPRRRIRRRARRTEKRTNGDASPAFLNNGDRKRRAIGFMVATATGAPDSEPRGLKDDDLIVEDIDLDSILLDQGQPPLHNQSVLYAPISNGPQQSMIASPPVECIPDPLLVAAQHAAGEGGACDTDRNMDSGHGSGSESAKGLLFLGDCYSSVTEEETSLAEDEASLSAISVGGNTTTSVGGMTMASSKGGIARCHSSGSDVLPGVHRAGSKDILHSLKDLDLMAAPPRPSTFGEHSVNNAMQQQDRSHDYNSLNRFLGGLHQERQHRKSAATSPHRREASFHSLGSMGVNSNVSGNSHRSCPNYFMNCASTASSWRGQNIEHSAAPIMMVNGGNDHMGIPPSPGEMDVDMEGPSNHPTTCGSSASVASIYGSRTTSSANASQAGSEEKQSTDVEVPKWKRRVKLPTHSSLY
eukprot:CCRYP_008646-RA/>CCRYP_008646-RA protein AED:0.03 eAED:0.03 QI:356/-1/1/1/-1/1/1/159/613